MDLINPRVDIAFKKIFGVEENKDLLVSLINSVVKQEDEVKEATLLNPYNLQNFRKEKLSVLDIKAVGENGKRFNIEVQIADTGDYDKRALYYWAKLYTDQLRESGSYSELSKSIGIHILNFDSIFDVSAYHNVFQIREEKSGLLYFKDLELHTIELKKFTSNVHHRLRDLVGEVKTSLDAWAAFLTRHDLLDPERLPLEWTNRGELKKALNVLTVMQLKGEERDAYEGQLKWMRDEVSALEKKETQGFEKGLAEGRVEGLAEGRAEGLVEGRVEGERNRAQEIARNLKQQGVLSLDQISKITGLTMQQVQKLS